MGHLIVTGAAGFVGSHLIDRLLAEGNTVVGIDNLSLGSRDNLRNSLGNERFRLLEFDLTDVAAFRAAAREIGARGRVDAVWHMAANSDIQAGVADPGVDIRNTFLTTANVLTVMREFGIEDIAFPSSSAVYGVHDAVLTENTGPLFPISNYGAMKLASEGLISAAVESHLRRAYIFRFPNIVGSRMTHGIIYDLFGKLANDPGDLEVLGDGTQQKPYLHVSELVDAMSFIVRMSADRINCFNISAEDEGATVKYIAETVAATAAPQRKIRYTGGSRGWVGDIPRFRYSAEKLTRLGWRPTLGSEESVRRAVAETKAECSS